MKSKFILQKKIKKIILFSILLFLNFPKSVKASSLFIAPSVGYQSFNLKLTDNTDVEHSSTLSGPVYGLKLGVKSATGVHLALAGAYTSGKTDIKTGTNQSEYEYKHTTGAIQIGIKPKGVFSIYIGYLAYNELKTYSDQNDSRFKGPGYQLGLELGLTQNLNLGFQYELYQFKEMSMSTDGGEYTDIKNYFKNTDAQNLSAFLIYYF